MYSLLVRMAAKPECLNALFDAVSGVAAKARAEDGCLVFEPFRPIDGSASVMIFEKWTEKSAMQMHMGHDYMTVLMAQLHSWLAGEPELIDMIGVDG